MSFSRLFVYGFIGWALAGMGATAAEDVSAGRDIYMRSCFNCHGARMQGGNAKSLMDGDWEYGSSRSHITRNIKYGLTQFGMPAYMDTLTDEEIKALVDFILETEKSMDIPLPEVPPQLRTLDYIVSVDVIAEGLDTPWAIDFTAPNQALITERPGALRRWEDGRLLPEPVQNTPAVVPEGQGGLLDVAVDPEYPKNGWLYLAYSHARPGAEGGRVPAMTRIVRGRIRDNQWVDQEVLFEAPHESYRTTRIHYGCRIVFTPDGLLWFSIGERGHQDDAQDLSKPNGKIHRIGRDGSIPKDNPFVNREGALPSIYSYGHRNPQGVAVDPVTGTVWVTEHGPMGGDELNRIVKGANYGWPKVTYGINYNGTIISDQRTGPEYTNPIVYWRPSPALCGLDFVRGDRFPLWKGNLLNGALKFEQVTIMDMEEERVLHEETILKNAGRVRDVTCGPDGLIYVVLNQPGTVLRLSPAGRTPY